MGTNLTACLPCLQPRSPEWQTNKAINEKLRKWHCEERATVQVVLLGTGESGKSTITKQMKIIHMDDYSDEERQEKVMDIRRNVRDAILTISGAMSLLNLSLKDETLQDSIDYLMSHATLPDFAYPQEFYDHTWKLWMDPGFQSCYRRSNEYQLIDCAKYFLDQVCSIRRETYIPSNQDILRCRVMTNTIQKIEYTVKDGKTNVPFNVFDLGGQRGERQKWIQVFDAATAILFLLDCSSFDLTLREEPTKNRILEALEIFDQVWNHRWLWNVDVILFINKIDLLDEKIENGHRFDSLVNNIDPNNKYYELFQQYKSFSKPKAGERREFLEAFPISDDAIEKNHNYINQNGHGHGHGLAEYNRKRSRSLAATRTDVHDETVRTAVFMKRLFMQIMEMGRQTVSGHDWHSDHNCDYFYTCAINTDNIKKVLNGCKSLIIKKHLARWGIRL